MNITVTTRRRVYLVTLLLGAFIFTLTANETAFAKLCGFRSPVTGALAADAIIIARPATVTDFFEVEDVISGGANTGDIIQLPDFRLRTCNTYKDDSFDAITPDTRI